MTDLKFIQHFPYSARHETAEVKSLEGFGTPGETVAFSFSILSQQDVAEVKVSASSLVASKATIESATIHIYIVKLHPVSGVGVRRSASMIVPELLLKDDREPLVDGYREHPGHGLGSMNSSWIYCPPLLRLAGDANTSLFAEQPKQIWFSVKVPGDTSSGTYSGWLEIAWRSTPGPDRGFDSIHRLPITLDVLPVTLDEPEVDLLMWYMGSMDAEQTQFYVSEDLFRLQLQDIYDHGFRSISISESDTSRAQLAIDIAESIGFDRHVVFRHIPLNPEALRFRKLRPVLYLSDEIDAVETESNERRQREVAEHQSRGTYCKKLNWLCMASLVDRRSVVRLRNAQDIGHQPDIISLSLSENKDLFAQEKSHTSLAPSLVYYHWPAHMEKPNLHRLLAGLYLWKAGAQGIAPYCYQHLPIFPFSPFDDFDAFEPFTMPANVRDKLATYPARGGVIPTLQWEGLREGVIDMRYLITLQRVLALTHRDTSAELKMAAEEAERMRDQFLARITLESIEIGSDSETEPYLHFSAADYHHFRKQMADAIVSLLR